MSEFKDFKKDLESRECFLNILEDDESNFEEKLGSCVDIMEKHSIETTEHINGVGELFELGAKIIREQLDNKHRLKKTLHPLFELNDRELGLMGKTHDIGKLFIPLDILHKKGKLDYNDWKIMELHTLYGGYAIDEVFDSVVNKTEKDFYMRDISKNIALNHHKGLNGGYPSFLEVGGITPYSEFLRLCDIYDALRRKRAYKEPMERNEALKIIYGLRNTVKYKFVFNLFIDIEDDFSNAFFKN